MTRKRLTIRMGDSAPPDTGQAETARAGFQLSPLKRGGLTVIDRPDKQ